VRKTRALNALQTEGDGGGGEVTGGSLLRCTWRLINRAASRIFDDLLQEYSRAALIREWLFNYTLSDCWRERRGGAGRGGAGAQIIEPALYRGRYYIVNRYN